MSSEVGELGEFDAGYGIPEEISDPFYEPESYREDNGMKLPEGICIQQMHYA